MRGGSKAATSKYQYVLFLHKSGRDALRTKQLLGLDLHHVHRTTRLVSTAEVHRGSKWQQVVQSEHRVTVDLLRVTWRNTFNHPDTLSERCCRSKTGFQLLVKQLNTFFSGTQSRFYTFQPRQRHLCVLKGVTLALEMTRLQTEPWFHAPPQARPRSDGTFGSNGPSVIHCILHPPERHFKVPVPESRCWRRLVTFPVTGSACQ